ncbi:polyketide synthase [Microbispora rosea subsp. aerata]|nr:fatty acyl-AMP ligase [Microbispora rosea]GGO10215.1 polyketide synthase [Microbispora rosea subsp. aerata]GIH53332.1 polyketide synthase [Microbispora rosea subsp. aerata]GLJ83012.1 polyketide synthase [Microbispora rosea subsp. aerata]
MVDLPHATSAAAVISEHARSTPERTALIFVDDVERADGATQWSYAQLDAEARRIGAWLRARFSAGDRVLLLYPTGLDFAAAFVGCLYTGTVAVPAPLPGRYRHERARVRSIAENAAVSAILTDNEHLPVVAEWAEAEGLTGIPLLATDSADLVDPGDWTPENLNHETLAMLQYTSGSTGEPKGVMLTHGNILHNVDGQRRACSITQDTRLGGWIPLYHDMGLLGQLMPALLLGATCVLMRPSAFLLRPHHWLWLIDKYDIDLSAAPDFAYELCCARITEEQVIGLDLSRWRFSADGAEPINAATMDMFAKRFAPVGLRDDVLCPCYGMAESTVYVSGEAYRKAVVTTVDPDELEQHRFVPSETGTDLVSCGTPRDHDVLIADPRTGEVLPPGVVGEIWLRGPSVSKSYWRNDAANERAFTPSGYVRTGDLGTLHEGELYVTGRLDEVINVCGRYLYPQDIERELRARHPELGSAGAVFAVSLPEAGSEDLVIVTHEINGRQSEARLRQLAVQIRQTVARRFGIHVDGVALLRRGGVRRTTSGKIQRAEMRRLFLDGELSAVCVDYELRLANALWLNRQGRASREKPARVHGGGVASRS